MVRVQLKKIFQYTCGVLAVLACVGVATPGLAQTTAEEAQTKYPPGNCYCTFNLQDCSSGTCKNNSTGDKCLAVTAQTLCPADGLTDGLFGKKSILDEKINGYQVANVQCLFSSQDHTNDCSEIKAGKVDPALNATGDGAGPKPQTKVEIKKPVLNILIPDLKFSDVQPTTDEDGNVVIPWVGEYVAAIYSLAVSVASIVAVILLIREGVLIILSGGGEEKIQGYRNIGRIAAGLVLAWSSYVILYNINSSLVSFQPLKIRYAVPIEVDSSDEVVAKTAVFSPENGVNNVPYFPQWEGSWAEMKPGDPGWPSKAAQEGRKCTTIHQRGCGATSLAMVLKFYGEDVTPIDTARWGLGCTGAWQPYDTMDDFSNEWPSLKGEILRVAPSNKAAIRTKVMTLLLAGKPIVYHCAPCNGLNKNGEPYRRKTGDLGYRGHYVVLTGIASSGYSESSDPSEVILTVNDPGANPDRRIRTMTLAQVLDAYKVAVYIDTQGNFQSVNAKPSTK
jgi:hypothetical protein